MRTTYTRSDITLAKTLLASAALPRDSLPYTDDFDRLHTAFHRASETPLDQHGFWGLLCRAGKEGGAKAKAKAPRVAPLSQEEAFEILRLCPERIGSRDRLPYTTEFDDMYRRFCSRTSRSLTRNDFWRSLLRLAKRTRKPTPVDIQVAHFGISAALEHNLFDMNPWWKGEEGKPLPPHRRNLFDQVYRRITDGVESVLALRGPRQVGKTTLQQHAIRMLLQTRRASASQILRVQFDELPSLGRLSEPILSISRWYQDKILKKSLNESARLNQPTYMFLDETQDLPSWDVQLKSLVDHHACRVFVTGSSALRLQLGHDSLAGRLTALTLGPLHLSEVAKLREMGPLEPYQAGSGIGDWSEMDFWEGLRNYDCEHPMLLESVFLEFSKRGGYPYCHAKPDIEWPDIASYLESVVKRTLDHDLRAGGDRTRDVRILKEVFRLAARYAGQSPKVSTLARELSQILEANVPAREIARYLDFLENSLLLNIVAPLQHRLRKQPGAGKLCLCDHALRAAWLHETVPLAAPEGEEHPDSDIAGHLAESIVGHFLSGFPGLQVSHFPTRPEEPEVDFIISLGVTPSRSLYQAA